MKVQRNERSTGEELFQVESSIARKSNKEDQVFVQKLSRDWAIVQLVMALIAGICIVSGRFAPSTGQSFEPAASTPVEVQNRAK